MPELQQILQQYGNEYKEKHDLPIYVKKTLNAIEKCRTAELGAHIDICDECGYEKISYNSCRNRHCPKCQTSAKEKWIYNQKFNVLNVKYFHVVFTIPDILNKVVYYNQTKMYNIMFKAASETLQELANDKKYLGAQIGFTTILHTWGQNLKDHPHIHCIVPAGGLDSLGKWRNSKKKFFIPVKVLSKVFRGKLIYFMKQEKLEYFKEIKNLKIIEEFDKFISSLYSKDWVVYCKPPFKNANSVIEYLGRYTHRVAISNSRILNIENKKVTFKWRDYRDNNKMKTMILDAEEFIRRFVLHILPPRFMKIRHFGLLGNRNKTKKLTLCKSLTNTKVLTKENISPLELLKKISGNDFNLCPICGKRTFNKTKSSIIIYNLIPFQNCLFIGEGVSMSILLKFYMNFN